MKRHLVLLLLLLCIPATAADFDLAFGAKPDRVWAGPDLWANRLQDWHIRDGALHAVGAGPRLSARTVHLLSHDLIGGGFVLTATVAVPDGAGDAAQSLGGFLVGAGGGADYRSAALIHSAPGPGGGVMAGIDGAGRAVFRSMEAEGYPLLQAGEAPGGAPGEWLRLRLGAVPLPGRGARLALTVVDGQSGRIVSRATHDLDHAPVGAVALISHHPAEGAESGYRFGQWRGTGPGIVHHPGRGMGPIISAQHTVSRGVLKLNAQLMPIAHRGSVSLEVREGWSWVTAGVAPVHVPGYTAVFRVEDWPSDRDTPYRIRCWAAEGTFLYEGIIRSEPPVDRDLVLAAFTGNHNTARGVESRQFPWSTHVWFPHADLVSHVAAHEPDLLFFSGDQVYEGASPTHAVRGDGAWLDYLYKWYLWCWAFRDLTREIPAVILPDDHDVYQGNIWGQGGRPTDRDHNGGYVMPADWVNMVQRTQMDHLPDPHDPTPIDQGITVHYGDLLYGGVSLAVIEDRKFKTGPNGVVPPTDGRPDHVTDPDYDPSTADVPGAKLLGDRQLEFLEHWAGDWQGAYMKAALSQTVFAGAATHHGGGLDYLVADFDSNGWPQTGRDEALRRLRMGFAAHIAGDQHLATLIHHGIDAWGDGPWSFAVPSVANFYLRAWRPPYEPEAAFAALPSYTGRYFDGLGNRITMWAATNPGESMGVEPSALHDKKPGYGIVRFDKQAQTITFECWPRFVDPTEAGDEAQYDGWPRTVSMFDNYGATPAGFLSDVARSGIQDPVVRVLAEDGDTLYTVRVRGRHLRPKVFEPGQYRIMVGADGVHWPVAWADEVAH
ncbi:MAG: hypothetical protein GF320_02815 [Armatimonadia bacterium]|nr:hypothetical protein [Armatimonadia bacterium]